MADPRVLSPPRGPRLLGRHRQPRNAGARGPGSVFTPVWVPGGPSPPQTHKRTDTRIHIHRDTNTHVHVGTRVHTHIRACALGLCADPPAFLSNSKPPGALPPPPALAPGASQVLRGHPPCPRPHPALPPRSWEPVSWPCHSSTAVPSDGPFTPRAAAWTTPRGGQGSPSQEPRAPQEQP